MEKMEVIYYAEIYGLFTSKKMTLYREKTMKYREYSLFTLRFQSS